MNQGYGIDYKVTCFKHPEVQKIYGEPTLDQLLDLHSNIKANFMTVHASLGGGQHGHLGLTCQAEKFSEILDTEPYVRPENPAS